MIERDVLKNLDIDQLVSLALYTEEYNIHFFRSWANRLRPFDPEMVELMAELAADAEQYRDTLYETSQRLFQHGLPEPQPELYLTLRRNLDLPDDRYFVVSEKEARSILNTALALQRDTIELLTMVDNALRRDFEEGLLDDETETDSIGGSRSSAAESEQSGFYIPRRLQ
jgi:hypothetical protein